MKPNIELDELIDLVDEHDQLVTTAWRSQVDAQKLKYRRVVFAFLRDSQGKVCLFRRAAHKSDPGTISLPGGHVQSGESYDIAFKREVLEELRIDVDQYPHRFLGMVGPHETWPGNNHKGVYEITVPDLHIDFNPDDFSEFFWVHPHEFMENLASYENVGQSMAYVLQKFYLMRS